MPGSPPLLRPPSTAVSLTLLLTILAVAVVYSAIPQGSQTIRQPAQGQEPTTRIVLTLTELRQPSINGQLVRWDRLDGEFRAIYERRPVRLLFVRAHPNNDYQAVDRVVSLAKRRGITVQFQQY